MLAWHTFSNGRLLIATGSAGYYELTIGGRCFHGRHSEGALTLDDLGPCTAATLQACQDRCEQHELTIINASQQ